MLNCKDVYSVRMFLLRKDVSTAMGEAPSSLAPMDLSNQRNTLFIYTPLTQKYGAQNL
jgi:hypothetical protein